LSIVLAPRFEQVGLWVYEQDVAARMRSGGENDMYLPGFRLPGNVAPTSDIGEALADAGIVLSVMPSHHTRALYRTMLPFLNPSMLFVSATKGLETGTLLRMTQVIAEVLRPAFEPRVGVISGPTFAREVAGGTPTALVAASADADLARSVQSGFSGPTFRLYRSSDPIGVEIGGAVKNVVAIGAGVCYGLGLGSNTMAALITRGLAEITRLAQAMGAQTNTLSGLAGLGDLVLTCTGELSRNRSVGLELARGRTLPDIVGSMRMVAEGIKTTEAVVDLAQRYDVEMPIARQMHAVFHDGRNPREAIQQLMERSLKGE
jgi:glycerol-3-phosphate dehydrogenase (NAD(P)+)